MPSLQLYLGVVYLWKYIPSLPLAIVFASVFLVATFAHFWKMYRTKMWFCLPFVIGGLSEVVGYVCRALAYNATGSLALYLLQAMFLLLPPILFAASLYVVYAHVVRAVHGERFSPLPIRRTTLLFVFCDVTFLGVQGDGAGLLGKTKTAQIGTDIVVVGLILQILSFVAFIACCAMFHARFEKHVKQNAGEAPNDVPWAATLNMLYGTSVLILARNLYRVVEYIMGVDGYLQAHEWPTYAFDGALMLLVMAAFYVWYPSRLLEAGSSRNNGERIDEPRDSIIELTGNEGGVFPRERSNTMKTSETVS